MRYSLKSEGNSSSGSAAVVTAAMQAENSDVLPSPAVAVAETCDAAAAIYHENAVFFATSMFRP